MNTATPVTEATGAGAPVGGEFAIAGTLPTIGDVIDFKEERSQFTYGYYRFVEHPYLRKIREGLSHYYGVRHCLPVTSLETAFFELLEYVLTVTTDPSIHIVTDSNGIGGINWADAFREYPRIPVTPFPEDEWPSLDLTQVNRTDLWIVSVRNPAQWITRFEPFMNKMTRERGTLVVVTAQPRELPLEFRGPQFYLTGLSGEDENIAGAALLSNSDRQIMELRNRLKRRGPLLSSRNAASLLRTHTDSNPDSSVLSRLTTRISQLEQGSRTFLYPSGMNAIASVLDLVRTPETPQVISIGHLYSDTYTTLRDAPAAEGVPGNVFLGVDEVERLPVVISEHTGAVITESITNPLNDVPDLDFIAEITRKNHLTLIVDNSIATPVNCRPLDHGADIVVHSTTKFFSGVNDHGGGSVTVAKAALAEQLAAQQSRWRNEMSPLEARALWNNIQDLEDRMALFNRNAVAVAQFLEQHPAVSRVYYSGLPSHRSHRTAGRLLNGGSSVVSFVLRDNSLEGLQKMYDPPMQHIIKAPTLGSNHTLMCPYVLIAHYFETDEMLQSLGLSRYLVRVAVGCEQDITPVITDLERALAQGLS